jgi:hypothetical protein
MIQAERAGPVRAAPGSPASACSRCVSTAGGAFDAEPSFGSDASWSVEGEVDPEAVAGERIEHPSRYRRELRRRIIATEVRSAE